MYWVQTERGVLWANELLCIKGNFVFFCCIIL